MTELHAGNMTESVLKYEWGLINGGGIQKGEELHT